MTGPGQAATGLILTLAASIWGVYWLVLHGLVGLGLESVWAVLALNAVPLPLAAALCLMFRRQIRGYWPASLLVGALMGFGFALYAAGLVYSSVIRVTLLFYLMPLWGTLLGMAVLGEHAMPRRWAALVIGFAGMAVMLWPSGGATLPLNIGDLMALISGLLWAAGNVCMRRFVWMPLHGAMLVQFVAATLVALTVAWLGAAAPAPDLHTWLRAAPLSAAYACGLILPSMYVCLWCAKRLSPGRVGLLMMSEVVVAIVSAAWLLPEERMSLLEWSGAAAIAAAAILETSSREATARSSTTQQGTHQS